MRKLLLLALLAGAFMAPLPSAARTDVYVNVAPPPPRSEVMPHPRRGQAWAPGYWRWNGHAYTWVPGHWMSARSGARWVPEHWVQHGRRWVFVPGRWVRQ